MMMIEFVVCHNGTLNAHCNLCSMLSCFLFPTLIVSSMSMVIVVVFYLDNLGSVSILIFINLMVAGKRNLAKIASVLLFILQSSIQ